LGIQRINGALIGELVVYARELVTERIRCIEISLATTLLSLFSGTTILSTPATQLVGCIKRSVAADHIAGRRWRAGPNGARRIAISPSVTTATLTRYDTGEFRNIAI